MPGKINMIPATFGASPLFTINKIGEVLSVNDEAVAITGLTENKLAGCSFPGLFVQPETVVGAIQNLFTNGSVTDYPLVLVKWRSEEKRRVKLNAFVYTGTHETDMQMHAMVSLTPEKLSGGYDALQKITREIADYKYALDESSIVAITDQKGVIIHVNDNFCRISKYNREELLGKDHRIINSGYHSKEYIRDLWVTIANGEIWKGELRNKAKDGSYYWVNTTIVPFLDDSGKPFRYIAIREDITARKRIEEQQILYQLIIRSSDDAIISTDLTGIITSWNRGAEQVFEYAAEEVLGKSILMLLPDDNKNEEQLIIEKIKKGETINHYETIREKKSGKKIFISLTVSPVRNSGGQIIGLSKIGRDITERKQIEAELKKLNEELESRVKERTKEIESFSYSVSHDLRAPLRAVHGYARIVEEDYSKLLDDEGRRLLNEIQLNAKKMGTLIDDLLAFSRLGRKEVEKSMIDMNRLTELVVKEIRLSTEHHAHIGLEPLQPVMADYSLIYQVMLNLVSNAVKYSSRNERPLVHISSDIKDGEVIYSVKDNGVGFDMNYAGKLFGVFQRLHTQDEFPGTGVGLAIVQRVVHKHNGKVWAEGKEGNGATFYFSLPVSEN